MAAALVLPGQPVQELGIGAQLQPGNGTFERSGTLFASRMGTVTREGGMISVRGKDTARRVPDLESVVVGTITRINRIQATMTIQTVDDALCGDESDFQGVIRAQDVRQTEKDKVRIWHCFRPGDIVRATVLSLGDARSYYLTTAGRDLGVVYAELNDRQLEPVSWELMRDPETGETEPRKVAGPPSS